MPMSSRIPSRTHQTPRTTVPASKTSRRNSNSKRIEPEDWGPIYTKPPKPGKVDSDARTANQPAPGGQPYEFSATKHRAKLKAEFATLANAEKRAWSHEPGFKGGLHAAYVWLRLQNTSRASLHFILREGDR